MSIGPKTIYGKGLVLICVPLLVEVALGTSMFALQRYYGQKLSKERSAVEIMFHANEMWIDCTELLLSKANFSLFGGPKPGFEEREQRLSDAYWILKPLVAGNREQTETLERIHAWTQETRKLLDQLRPVVSTRQSGSGKMAILMSDLDIIKQVQTIVDLIADEIESFRHPEFLRSSAPIVESAKATQLLDRVVLGSLAASTAVAMLLLVYFVRSINDGVKKVIDDTERFQQGLPLKPAVHSGDELAQVDAAFQEMANEIREAQRTKQAIVAMISHDLRSPLTSVLGYLINVEDGVFGNLAPDTVSEAQECQRNVERLIRLISDLLDLDKIEAGRFELRPKPLSLDHIVERAINAVTSLAAESGVTIQSAEAGETVYADPDRIVQALANVLSTVVRLCPPGGRVETSAGHHNGEAEIRVTGAGAHMSEDQLESLFDRYRPGKSGLRLELPICQEIIKLHGGSSGVSSDAGGITFWLRLPSPQSSPRGGAIS